MASSRCSGLSPSIITPRSVSSFHAPWFMSSTMTFIPRFKAAFCVLNLVRRLELKNTIIKVLFLPSSQYLKRSALISKASSSAFLRSHISFTEVKCLILNIIYYWYNSFFIIITFTGHSLLDINRLRSIILPGFFLLFLAPPFPSVKLKEN